MNHNRRVVHRLAKVEHSRNIQPRQANRPDASRVCDIQNCDLSRLLLLNVEVRQPVLQHMQRDRLTYHLRGLGQILRLQHDDGVQL
jgi:hypothetical protein